MRFSFKKHDAEKLYVNQVAAEAALREEAEEEAEDTEEETEEVTEDTEEETEEVTEDTEAENAEVSEESEDTP